MPAKIQDKFQKNKTEEKLAECEGALVEMGYLREKVATKMRKKKVRNKKINTKIEEDEDEEIEFA